MVRWVALVALIACSACATRYQDMGFGGGVAAHQMTQDTFRIVARGNGYTSATAIQDYAILKAAETTKSHGGTHFVVVGGGDASGQGTITTPGQAQTTLIGNTAYTTYSPGMVRRYVKPGQDLMIRVISVAPGSAPPAGAIYADEIIQFVGSRVKADQG